MSPATSPALSPPGRQLTVLVAGAADVIAVLVFAAVGRRTHAEAGALLGLLATAGPFLAGLAIAWALTRAWRAPLAMRTGLLVWPVTAIAGLAVRYGFTGRLPVTFILVATLALGMLLLGWRAVPAGVRARSDRHGASAE